MEIGTAKRAGFPATDESSRIKTLTAMRTDSDRWTGCHRVR